MQPPKSSDLFQTITILNLIGVSGFVTYLFFL